MSREALEAVIGRAIIDAEFRLALFADPDATLLGYELTEGEVAAIKMLDAESLDAFAQVSARRIARKLQDTPQHPHEEGKMKAKLLTITVIGLLLSLLIACVSPMPAAVPPTPVATAVPPTPIPPPPPTTTPLAPTEPEPIRLANAYVAAMNRRNVEEALSIFTDDAEYAVAVQTSKGKSQVRTFFEYMDAIRMRVAQSDCKMEGEQVICSQRRQDDSMSAYGFNDVRFKFTYSFKDGKIQKAIGAADGSQWPAYSAMSKEATTWMAANRADEWKKVSDEKGALIRNGQTGPIIMKLAQDYAKTIQVTPAPTDLIGLANAYVAAMNRRDVEAAIALFTDDADYDAGVHSGAGKDRVRTILDYMDGTGMRMAHSDCSVKDAQAVCVQWRQDESMRALGYPGVRLRVTFSFKDGKIQHVAGTPEGPEYAQYIAATKEAMAWMAASRTEAWKKISDDKGALIRNGQTGPAVIMLVCEYAQEQSKKSAIK